MSNTISLFALEDMVHAALRPLTQNEREFIIDKMRESMCWSMVCELERMCQDELESPVCDLAKVGRMAESRRALTVISEANYRT